MCRPNKATQSIFFFPTPLRTLGGWGAGGSCGIVRAEGVYSLAHPRTPAWALPRPEMGLKAPFFLLWEKSPFLLFTPLYRHTFTNSPSLHLLSFYCCYTLSVLRPLPLPFSFPPHAGTGMRISPSLDCSSFFVAALFDRQQPVSHRDFLRAASSFSSPSASARGDEKERRGR